MRSVVALLALLSIGSLGLASDVSWKFDKEEKTDWIFKGPVTASPGTGGVQSVAPIRDCPNCTTCGKDCRCFGGGYYCQDGKCPIVLYNRELHRSSDGKLYEKHPDGTYREVKGASGVAPKAPFVPGTSTPTIGVPTATMNRPQAQVPGSPGVGINTQPTPTYVPSVVLPGTTSGCPNGNCQVPTQQRQPFFRRW